MKNRKIEDYLKKRKWLILLLFTFLIATGYFYFKVLPHSVDNVVVKLEYEIPGPLDDTPYKITSFIRPKNKYSFLVDKFIPVYFESSKLEKEINNEVEECVICYDYIFTGKLMYSKYSGYFLLVKSARLTKL